jgi:hypothetical protein
MRDLTDILLAHACADDQDADPDLLAGLLASLLRSEAARRGQPFCHVALFALVLRGTYASHPGAPNRRNGMQITRNLRHLVREYAAACGLPDYMLDEALEFSARIWNILHPVRERA